MVSNCFKAIKKINDNRIGLVNISSIKPLDHKKVIKIKLDEPFAYQFLASVLKNQDKIEEMIKIVNEGLKKNLINEKWEVQKKMLFCQYIV